MLRNILSLFLALFVVTGCAAPKYTVAPTGPASPRLLELMIQRLEIAQNVAWVKFVNHMQVSDPKRESEMLAALVERGRAMGISEQRVTKFFTAQIAASRRYQEDLIYRWKRGATLPVLPPQDLKRDIRPKLDAINSEMLTELARGERPGSKSAALSAMTQRGIPRNAAGIALK